MNQLSTDTESGYWQDSSRAERIKEILKNACLTDCKFVVGPDDETAETISCHKIFFILESPVFEKMFCGGAFKESQDMSEIRIIDAYPRDFKNLTLMIYNNSKSHLTQFSLDEIINLYQLCDKYMITSIAQCCIKHINNFDYLSNISLDRLITVFEFSRDLEERFLLHETTLVIQSRIKTLLKRFTILSEEAFYDFVKILRSSPQWPNQEKFIFSVISSYFEENNFLEIIKNRNEKPIPNTKMETNKSLEIKEKEAEEKEAEEKEADTKAIATSMRQISLECQVISKNMKIKNLFRDLLKLVKWETMTVQEFQDGPGKSKILDGDMKYYILSCLIARCKCGHNGGANTSYKCIHSATPAKVEFN